jgi:hypothetical protein
LGCITSLWLRTLRYIFILVFLFVACLPKYLTAQTDHELENFKEELRKRYLQPTETNFTAKGDTNFPVIGRWAWGPCQAVAAKDSFVFIGNGGLFQALLYSDTGQPQIIAEYLTEEVSDVEVQDSLVYVIGNGKLFIFAFSNLPELRKVSELSLNAPITQLSLADSFAYITSFFGALIIVDISEPSIPTIRSTLSVGFENTIALAVSGKFAYVGGLDLPDVQVVDVTNPDLPFVDTIISSSIVFSSTVQDTLLFLCTYYDLKIFSISNPARPQLISQFSFGDPYLHRVRSVATSAYYAYVATLGSGIFVVDISKPPQVAIIDSLKYTKSPSSGLKMIINNNTLLSPQYIGLWSINISIPETLRHNWFFKTADIGNKVVRIGNLAYVADGYAGLWILDVTKPESIKIVANVNPAGYAVDIAISGDHAYLLNYPTASALNDSTAGVWIIDISNPKQATIISHYRGSVQNTPIVVVNSIAVSNNLLFLTQSDSVLEIVDVTNPTMPTSRNIFGIADIPYDLTVQDTIAYVATWREGIMMLSIRNLDSPYVLTTILSNAFTLSLKDSLLYAVADSGLSILNVQNPSSPSLIGAVRLPGGRGFADISLANDFVYMTWDQIHIVDARNKNRPLEVAEFGLSWGIYGLTALNDTIIAVGLHGLFVFRNDFVTVVAERLPYELPLSIALVQNYPNPFNPLTKIRYSIAEREIVQLSIYNVLGQKISVIAEGSHQPGEYIIDFDGSNLTSGIYFLSLETRNQQIVRKMILVK